MIHATWVPERPQSVYPQQESGIVLGFVGSNTPYQSEALFTPQHSNYKYHHEILHSK